MGNKTTVTDSEIDSILNGTDDLIAAEAIDDLDAEIAADEALEELDAEIDLELTSSVEPVETVAEKTKVKKTKAKKVVKAKKADEVEVVEVVEAVESTEVEAKVKVPKTDTSGMKPSNIIDLKIGANFKSLAILNEGDEALEGKKLDSHIESILKSMDELPKKVGEKAVNVFLHLQNGIELSVYTQDAIMFLKDNGTMTKAELHDFYAAEKTGVRNKPYSKGTAGAQSSQMMKLLPFLGIADRSEMALTLNEDSILAQMLCA